MHSAHPTVGVSIALAARCFERTAIRPRKIRAVVGPKDQPSSMLVQKYLADFFAEDYAHDWNCSAIKAHGMPVEDLNPHEIDCLLLFGHPAVMNAEVLDRIYEYWQCGGSLVAVRIADLAQHGGSNFADDIFGGEYQCDHLLEPAKISLLHQSGNHPLLRGVHPFVSRGGLHRYNSLPPEATAIAFGSANDEAIPVAWVRSKLGRRVFATTLGSPADFRHPCFLRLLANAILWTAR